MNTRRGFMMVVGILFLAWLGAGESQAQRKKEVAAKMFAAGEKIYKEKNCAGCHTSSTTAQMKAPELATVYTALDTTFIKVHLRFQQETAMPPIYLNAKQVDDLSRYVSHLHAEKFQKVRDKDADAVCSVCSARLKMSEALSDGLQTRYNDRLYYFECKLCKEAFDKNPAWHILRWQDPNPVMK